MSQKLLSSSKVIDVPCESERGPFRITSKTQVYDNPWITVHEYQVITPAGTPGLYGVLSHKTRAACVLAVDPDGCLLLIRQFRFQLNTMALDIIQGGVPKGEALLGAAKRELQEDAGMQAQTWVELERFTSCNGIGDKTGGIFLAYGLQDNGQTCFDDEEELELVKVPLQTAFDMARSGEIADIASRAAIARLEVMTLRGELPSEFWILDQDG
ncbi:MAG: NUDIX hydrolase [Alphaproteobacteria bacterium]